MVNTPKPLTVAVPPSTISPFLILKFLFTVAIDMTPFTAFFYAFNAVLKYLTFIDPETGVTHRLIIPLFSSKVIVARG